MNGSECVPHKCLPGFKQLAVNPVRSAFKCCLPVSVPRYRIWWHYKARVRGRTRCDEILPTLIIRPPSPCAFIIPNASRVQRNGARKVHTQPPNPNPLLRVHLWDPALNAPRIVHEDVPKRPCSAIDFSKSVLICASSVTSVGNSQHLCAVCHGVR